MIGVNNERGEEMTQEKLKEILDKHSKWLNAEDGGERADLVGTDLNNTDLRYLNLSSSDLSFSDISFTTLRYVNLSNSDLSNSDLSFSDLLGADLRGADLTNAVYKDTILNLQCPEEGSFIAWKKLADNKIAKLLIPEDAKRSSATTRKCRASKAIVLAIYNEDGEEISEGRSRHDYEFIYRVGETVYPDHWDEDRWNACSNGIHFFITRKEAEEY